MNKESLEEQRERKQTDRVAAALGITANELESLDWSIQSFGSDDGLVHGHDIHFAKGSNPEILGRIKGLHDGSLGARRANRVTISWPWSVRRTDVDRGGG